MADRKISELDAAAALDGTELYEAVQGGANVKVAGDAVRNGKVKVYRALLTQSGTSAPTETLLENTLGGTPVWTRESVGVYRLTLVAGFGEGKTFVTLPRLPYTDPVTGFWILNADGVKADYVEVKSMSEAPSDNIIGNNVPQGDPIEILVYP